jgi:predicted SprT family Zn-dependent metalloprotease
MTKDQTVVITCACGASRLVLRAVAPTKYLCQECRAGKPSS